MHFFHNNIEETPPANLRALLNANNQSTSRHERRSRRVSTSTLPRTVLTSISFYNTLATIKIHDDELLNEADFIVPAALLTSRSYMGRRSICSFQKPEMRRITQARASSRFSRSMFLPSFFRTQSLLRFSKSTCGTRCLLETTPRVSCGAYRASKQCTSSTAAQRRAAQRESSLSTRLLMRT